MAMDYISQVTDYLLSNPWLAFAILLLAGLAVVRITQRLWGLREVKVENIGSEIFSALLLQGGT